VEAVAPLLQESGLVAMRERVRLLLAERARLAAALGASGQFTRVWPSDANFLLVDCREPDDVLTRARRAGLLIRDVRQAALRASVRISVGTPQENDRLLECLR
jgi:histidinol-phosphate/aromatic aminotransferase/cobyric acid decarboxylase-like protein